MRAFFDLPFIQVALPIVITLILASIYQNKRIDDLRTDHKNQFDDLRVFIADRFNDMNRRFDGVDKRLEKIEGKLELHGERITKVEERTSLVR